MFGPDIYSDPKQWESYANEILNLHYGPTDYQRVPDQHRGDFGIEGFVRSCGHVFQSYLAREPLRVDELYVKQRNKISKDLRKFTDNQDELARMLGPIRVTRWCLFVHRHESAKLVQYAQRKTEEIRKAGLPYVAETFHVHICTDRDFPVERARLAQSTGSGLTIVTDDLADSDIDDWQQQQPDSVSGMLKKLAKTPKFRDAYTREEFCRELIGYYIRGRNALEYLRSEYPPLYEDIYRCKKHRETYLKAKAMMSGSDHRILPETLLEYMEELKNKVTVVDADLAEMLAWEAVADWLMRCPLDFPGEVGTVA